MLLGRVFRYPLTPVGRLHWHQFAVGVYPSLLGPSARKYERVWSLAIYDSELQIDLLWGAFNSVPGHAAYVRTAIIALLDLDQTTKVVLRAGGCCHGLCAATVRAGWQTNCRTFGAMWNTQTMSASLASEPRKRPRTCAPQLKVPRIKFGDLL